LCHLLAQTQILDKGTVFFKVGPLDVLQKPPALSNQDKQTPLTGLVVLELPAVFRKVVDPFGKQGNLNLRRA
jgi:hypothetical protein